MPGGKGIWLASGLWNIPCNVPSYPMGDRQPAVNKAKFIPANGHQLCLALLVLTETWTRREHIIPWLRR